jgi:hypothetical protein
VPTSSRLGQTTNSEGSIGAINLSTLIPASIAPPSPVCASIQSFQDEIRIPSRTPGLIFDLARFPRPIVVEMEIGAAVDEPGAARKFAQPRFGCGAHCGNEPIVALYETPPLRSANAHGAQIRLREGSPKLKAALLGRGCELSQLDRGPLSAARCYGRGARFARIWRGSRAHCARSNCATGCAFSWRSVDAFLAARTYSWALR